MIRNLVIQFDDSKLPSEITLNNLDLRNHIKKCLFNDFFSPFLNGYNNAEFRNCITNIFIEEKE